MSQLRFPLDYAYKWEKELANEVYMTQPMGGGKVETYTWKRTLDEARRMASYIESLGFEKGSRIGVLSKNCAHFIMSDLAIWTAGHVSVALYPTLNADTVEYILDHSGCKMLFVGKLDVWDSMKPGVPEDMPCISYPLSPKTDFPTWNDVIKEHEPMQGEPKRAADDLAILVYTSGSTGKPKGAMHDFKNLAAAARGFDEIFPIKHSDRMLSYLPLAHVFERLVVGIGSLAYGFHVFFAESLDTFVQDLRRARPTLFLSVPRLWLKFQQGVFKKMPPKKLDLYLKIPILSGIVKKKVLQNLGLADVRYALSGSAPIPPELIDWYRRLGLELLEGYGMTENFAYSHLSLPGKTRVGYVGHSNPGVETKISEEGEILVKSCSTMLGYYRQEEMSKESFTEDGFLKTGDRGEIDSDGRLRITGRVKELFKTSKGKYVAPAPIENIINSHPAVEQSCVSGSGQPKAFAVLMLSEALRNKGKEAAKAEVEGDLEALLKKVNSEVEHHEQLQFFVVVKDEWQIENGFLTPTMKLKRNVIEDTYEPQVEGWYASKKSLIWE